jgi:hypothetical protein
VTLKGGRGEKKGVSYNFHGHPCDASDCGFQHLSILEDVVE